MKLLARLLALFLTLPVVELFLLIQLEEYADRLSGGYGLILTLGLILITGIVGSYLAKREGLSVWQQLQQRLDAGGLPGKELLDGVIILVAGALLITPGVLTDIVGFMGLLPPTRALIRKIAMKRIKRALQDGTIETNFSSFGAASWESTGEVPPEYNGGWPSPEQDPDWKGAGRDVPHHRETPEAERGSMPED